MWMYDKLTRRDRHNCSSQHGNQANSKKQQTVALNPQLVLRQPLVLN